MNEEWRPVEGTGGLYEISSLGRIRSYNNGIWGRLRVPRIMKPQLDTVGYPGVTLGGGTRGSIPRRGVIHRLVAEAFIPNPENLPQVNHEDGDKTNNVVENLTWMTNTENIRHSWRIGIRHMPKGADSWNAKFTVEAVAAMKGALIAGVRVSAIAREYNISRAHLRNIRNGFHWADVAPKIATSAT